MDTSEILIGSGQIASSIILGGMALLYSHRVYKIENNRDNQKEKEKKLSIVKYGYNLGSEYMLLPLEIIRIVPTINHSKGREKYEEFQVFAQKIFGSNNFPDLIENKYRDIFESEPHEVEEKYFGIITDLSKKSAEMNKQVIEFLFDIKSLKIKDEELDKLIYKLFDTIKMRHSLDWSSPVLLAHYNSYYQNISDLVIEISNCVDNDMHKS